MNCIEEHCEHTIYENNKCIFHCDKTLENGWLSNENDKYNKYNDKIKLFWEEFIKCHKKNINRYFSDFHFSDKFIIPFYHTNLIEGSTLVDIRELNDLKFHGAIFVDDFILKDGNKLTKLSFSQCSFKKECYLNNMNLNYLFIIHNNFSERFTIQDTSINNGEIMDLKSISSEHISINLVDIKVINKLEIWQFDDKNIKLEISDSNFQELELKELNLDTIKFTYKNKFINKLKLIDINTNNLHFDNTDFETDSKILFENIECKEFNLSQLSQDSKYIQFNHIKILDCFDINKIEFKNTYFNDVSIVHAKKIINKVSFVDSHLNSLEWGNINEIKAKRDIFRELKYIYDEQKSFIDANNFFAMEMESYKKELSNKPLFSNFWQEKIIFFVTKKISNFSQSWFLPLLWIFIINISFYILMKISNINFDTFKASFSLVIVISFFIITKLISEISKNIKNEKVNFYTFQHIFIIVSMLSIIDFFNFGSINDVMWFSNIQSYKDFIELSNDKDVFQVWATHKILLGFLIYHFVISLRRQTKR